MKLTYNTAVVFVRDIEKTKKFYQVLLHLEIEYDFGKNVAFKGGLAIWELRDEHIVPQQLKSRMLNHGNRFELYFETTDFDASYNMLKQQQIEFLHEKHIEPWGQYTVRFYDPDGHLIEIGETIQTFVKRMNSNGMTNSEIAKKTHIPIETVVEFLKQ